jgi:hypothetical protein
MVPMPFHPTVCAVVALLALAFSAPALVRYVRETIREGWYGVPLLAFLMFIVGLEAGAAVGQLATVIV